MLTQGKVSGISIDAMGIEGRTKGGVVRGSSCHYHFGLFAFVPMGRVHHQRRLGQGLVGGVGGGGSRGLFFLFVFDVGVGVAVAGMVVMVGMAKVLWMLRAHCNSIVLKG